MKTLFEISSVLDLAEFHMGQADVALENDCLLLASMQLEKLNVALLDAWVNFEVYVHNAKQRLSEEAARYAEADACDQFLVGATA